VENERADALARSGIKQVLQQASDAANDEV
jgi:hypothetical protein